MAEDKTNGAPVDETSASGKSETTQIADELGKLGHKVVAAVQTAMESEEFKKADTEIRKALRMAGERIDEVAEDVRKSDVTKDLQSQASRAAGAVQQSDVTRQIKTSVWQGLRRLNTELTELLDRSASERSAADVGQAAAQAGEEAAQKASEAAAKAGDAIKDNIAQG